MTKQQAEEILGDRASWELRNMYKALNSMRLLNSEEDEERLEAVSVMLGKAYQTKDQTCALCDTGEAHTH